MELFPKLELSYWWFFHQLLLCSFHIGVLRAAKTDSGAATVLKVSAEVVNVLALLPIGNVIQMSVVIVGLGKHNKLNLQVPADKVALDLSWWVGTILEYHAQNLWFVIKLSQQNNFAFFHKSQLMRYFTWKF